MIEVIKPTDIEKEEKLINELKLFGLDYFSKDSWIGWNYILDHIWLYKKIDDYLKENKSIDPIVFDVGCGNSPFHNFIEKSLSINITGLDRPDGFCHQNTLTNVDYNVEFLDFNGEEVGKVDILYWLSSIEHNNMDMIERLYRKSLSLLKPGGILLITFPLSEVTVWFEDSQQTNLSIEDATRIFDDTHYINSFEDVRKQYFTNVLCLKERYEKRYGHFLSDDPKFIVAGLEQKVTVNLR